MKQQNTSVWLCGVTIALLSVVMGGCGGGGDDLGATVEGTVTLDGSALPVGGVTFIPTMESAVAVGAIGPDGGYSLRTGTLEGLAPGDYRVTVVATELPPGDEGNLVDSPEPPKLLTPREYGKPETSGLSYTVKPGSNTIDIKLVSTPK